MGKISATVSASGAVTRLRFSADGALLAAAREYAVEVRDGNTGRPLRVLAGHTGDVRDVAFSPDGTFLASASRDHTVRIWAVATGEVVRSLPVRYPSAVRYLPGGRRLVVATWSAGILLFDGDGDATPLSSDGADTMFDSLAFSRDGALIAALERHGAVRVYEVATGTLRLRVPGRRMWDWLFGPGDGRRQVEVDFAEDDTAVAAVAFDGTIRVWDLATGRPRSSAPAVPRTRRPLTNAVFLPDPLRLVGAGSQVISRIPVRDAATGAVVDELSSDGLPTAFAVAPDGRRLAAGTSEGMVHLWPQPRGAATTHHDDTYNPLWGVLYSPDGRLLVTVANDGNAHLWDVSTGRVRETFRGELHRQVSIAFTPDSSGIAVAGPRIVPQIRDLSGDRVRLTLDRPAGQTDALALSADGRRLVTVDRDQRVRVWDAGTGDVLHTVEAKADRVVLTPDGETIALVTSYGIRMWHPPTGPPKAMFPNAEGRGGVHSAVAFSPDGRLAAAAGANDSLLIWSVATGRPGRTFTGQGSVKSVAFSPRGDLLATAPFDGAPRIHDFPTGALRHVLSGHLAPVSALAFAPDGATLVTASLDGAARIWNTATGTLLTTLVPPRAGRR